MVFKIALVLIVGSFNLIQCSETFQINGRSYFISQPQKESYFNAFRYCSYIGRYLVDIRNELEQNRLGAIFNALSLKYDVNQQYWTAGSDLGKEGSYSFMSTGQPAIYTNWANGQPDNLYDNQHGETENCISINGETLLWDDNVCAEQYYFICRDSLDVPTYPTRGCPSLNATQ